MNGAGMHHETIDDGARLEIEELRARIEWLERELADMKNRHGLGRP